MSMIPLTKEQRSDFNRDGYLFVGSFLSSEDVEKYNDRLVQIMNREVDKPENMLVMKDIAIAKGRVKADAGQDQVQKIQDIHNDEVFKDLLRLPKILDYAENWTGPNIQSVHNMVINKPPNLDGRHPLHQDLLYFPFRPAEKIVGIWIALSDTRRENGTLAVVPGSHKGGELHDHETPSHMEEGINLAYEGVKEIDISKRVHIEAKAGDALFFHPLLVHGSGRNRTQDYRRVFISHYASSECTYLPYGEEMAKFRFYECVRGEKLEGCL